MALRKHNLLEFPHVVYLNCDNDLTPSSNWTQWAPWKHRSKSLRYARRWINLWNTFPDVLQPIDRQWILEQTVANDYLFWTMTSCSSWENQCTFDAMESSARKNNQLISTSNFSSKQSYMKHLYSKQSQLTKDITGERLSCVVRKNYHKRNWNRTKAVHWQRHVNRLDTVFFFVEAVNWA